MAVNDTFADIAALLNPMPARTDDNDDVWNDMAGSVWEAREADAGQLRLGWEHQDEDPLLSTLDSLRARRLRLEADMRLLIAYGRRFVYPRPYKLIDLAEAAGDVHLRSPHRLRHGRDRPGRRDPRPLPGPGRRNSRGTRRQ